MYSWLCWIDQVYFVLLYLSSYLEMLYYRSTLLITSLIFLCNIFKCREIKRKQNNNKKNLRISPTLITHMNIFFWPHHVACGILVPRPGIWPMPPALEVWSLNHWTTREVPVTHMNILQTKAIHAKFWKSYSFKWHKMSIESLSHSILYLVNYNFLWFLQQKKPICPHVYLFTHTLWGNTKPCLHF